MATGPQVWRIRHSETHSFREEPAWTAQVTAGIGFASVGVGWGESERQR
jgi:hypothetical protein